MSAARRRRESLGTMKDNNGTKQACSGPKLAAAGLLSFLAACAEVPPGATSSSATGPIASQFPLLSRSYPGLLDDSSIVIVDDTQPETVVYYSEYGYGGYGYFPNAAYSPYGYFGYPYRYRPYGVYPRRHHLEQRKSSLPRRPWAPVAGVCGPACGPDGSGVASGWDGPGIFAEPGGPARGSRARAGPRVGPQPPAVGPQPPLVGPRLMQPLGWHRGAPSRSR
jgi:hypothetical protein